MEVRERMLPPFIIERIKRREEERRRRGERPGLRLPLDDPPPSIDRSRYEDDQDEGNRGVVVIDFNSTTDDENTDEQIVEDVEENDPDEDDSEED
jgi:hypothetical protein